MAKRIFILLGALLVIILAVSAIGFATNGFDKDRDNWGITQLNEDNLFSADSYSIKSANTGDGYEVTVSEDGHIKVKGTNESGAEVKLAVQEIKLASGTYTFTSGVSGASKSSYCMMITDGTTTHYADFSNNTFEISAEATFTAYIVIQDKADINVTFEPVLVPGEDAGTFYVTSSK